MSVSETVVRFGPDDGLVGVLGAPEAATGGRPGVVLLSSGIVHRMGPNRLYVTIARRLAAAGFPTLRMDFSGVGDSPPRADPRPFRERCVEETIAALDALGARAACDGFVAGGICSGADAALLTAQADARVRAVAAVNARRFLLSDGEIERVRGAVLSRHYRRIATSRSFGGHSLAKLSGGKMSWRDVVRAVRSQIPRPGGSGIRDGTRALRSLLDRGVRVWSFHSEADEGLDCLRVLAGRRMAELQRREGFRFEVLEGADHTFTMRWSQAALLDGLESWLEELRAR